MTKFQFCLLLLLIHSSIVFGQKGKFLPDREFKDFVPIAAIEYRSPISIVDDSGKTILLTTKELSIHKDLMNKFLSDFSVYVTIERTEAGGKISYAVADVSTEKGNYTVIVDFVKCNTIDLILANGTCGGFGKVGVGMRLRANITTKKSGLNIGDLFGLALAAQKGSVTGTLSFDVIGIQSKEVTNLIPLPPEISPASIANALQAMSTIKSKIEDDNTSLHPKLVAIKQSNSSICGVDAIIETIKITPQEQHQQQQQPQQQRQEQQQLQQRED